MSIINFYGDPLNPIWVVTGDPYDRDYDDGYLFSSGYGYNFKKIWSKLANLPDPHIRAIRPCLGATYDNPTVLSNLIQQIEQYKPTFIIPLTDEILNFLVPPTKQIKEKNSSIRKWAGSLLTSPFISYPHYIICSHPPDWVTRNWNYHEIQGFIDFGHIKEEYDFWKTNSFINPLPNRSLVINPSFPDLWTLLNDCFKSSIISLDIETIRPKKNTKMHSLWHPGYPMTNAIATSTKHAFSYSFWDYTPEQTAKLMILQNKLFKTAKIIGQNFFVFDSHYLERMGLEINLADCQDTIIRHHILWIGLPHSLQFQTKQYTRQPFYKDEAQGFNWLYAKEKIMRYNCLDAAVTMEIYEKQEEEFKKRPYLK